MASDDIFSNPPMAQAYLEDLRQHAATLMVEFDAIMLVMEDTSSGVTEGKSQSVEDLSREETSERKVRRISRSISLSGGVPRQLFNALYQSFSQLNSKLASRVETDTTPECIGSDPAQDYNDLTRPSSHEPASPQSLSYPGLCNLDRTLKPSEGPFAGMNDRCCVCSTPASKEEIMTTPCCIRAVGSICFEEGLLEDGKCRLCQAHPYKSDVHSLDAPSDGAFAYKFHFIPATCQDDSDAAPLKSQDSEKLDERKHQTEERVDHLGTKIHKLKLLDRKVISHLEGVQEERLLSMVHSALQNRVHHTACKGFFQRAQHVQERWVNLSICSKCSQEPDMLNGLTDWYLAFESFVLTDRLRRFRVTMGHIQVQTMSIVGSLDKAKTVQKLLKDNASILQSLTGSGDVEDIHWNGKITGLKPRDYASITVTFSSAQLANEAIEHGLLWNHERRVCKTQAPCHRITQCGNCQAYGHISKECSSATRCRLCAGLHISTACTHDPTADKESLRCALCGVAHNATDEDCNTRKAERQRLQLARRFYPTGL